MEVNNNFDTISVSFNKQKFLIEVNTEKQTLKELTEKIYTESGIPIEYQKILHKGKNILTDKTKINNRLAQFNIKDKSTLLLIGSYQENIDDVQNFTRDDPLIMGFDEEIRRHKLRKKFKSSQTVNPYIDSYDALPENVVGNNPPREKALERLKEIANDPGILDELFPEGKVGVSEVCVLGLNTNKGAKISLRIRTDDFKGLRSFGNMRDVMLHELVHNKFSEHNDDFWSLFRVLKNECESLNWEKTGGKKTSKRRTKKEYFEEDNENEKKEYILGGSKNSENFSVSEISKNAAEKRFLQNTITNTLIPDSENTKNISNVKKNQNSDLMKNQDSDLMEIQDSDSMEIQDSEINTSEIPDSENTKNISNIKKNQDSESNTSEIQDSESMKIQDSDLMEIQDSESNTFEIPDSENTKTVSNIKKNQNLDSKKNQDSESNTSEIQDSESMKIQDSDLMEIQDSKNYEKIEIQDSDLNNIQDSTLDISNKIRENIKNILNSILNQNESNLIL